MTTLNRFDLSSAALLSYAAYAQNTTALRSEIDKSGWTLRGDGLYETFTDAGFFATSGNTLAIVFRGTDNFYDKAQWLDGAELGWPLQVADFYNLVKSAKEYMANPANSITNVLLTGHSMGGAVAEIYQSILSNQSYTTRGITFGSPGSWYVSSPNNNVLNFRNTDDVVPELGTVNGIEPSIDLLNTSAFTTEHKMINYGQEVGALTGSRLFENWSVAMSEYTIVIGDQFASSVSSGWTEASKLEAANDSLPEGPSSKFVLSLGGADVVRGSPQKDLIDGGDDDDKLFGLGRFDICLKRWRRV